MLEEERGNENGKVVIVHESVELFDEPMESCTGTRLTDTRVGPRYVDASRDAILTICYFVLFVSLARCFI